MINKLKYLITFFLFITNYQVLHSEELSLLSEEKLDKKELNILIKEYILKNPEIIIEAIEIYQKRQNSKTIDKEKKLIKSLRTEIWEHIIYHHIFVNSSKVLKCTAAVGF